MKLFTAAIDHDTAGGSRRERERAAAAALLRDIFGIDVEYGHEPSGAPVIVVAGQRQRVSISHSATTVAIAVAGDEESVGVDVETFRHQLERVKSKYLSARELSLFTSPAELLKAWTAKEAVYKAALTPGLSLTEIDCTDLESGIATARSVDYRVSFPVTGERETIAVAVTYPAGHVPDGRGNTRAESMPQRR